MNRKLKIIIASAAALLVLLIIALLFAYYMLHQPLPDYNGRIEVTGLNSFVKIYRDEFAVPVIDANSDEDASFAMGFVHAQERLFQMDIARRAGEGRLSEVFGIKTLPYDKMFRTLGIYNMAKEQYEMLSDESKKIYFAYASGVNAFIAQAGRKLSIEFDVLSYDPYEWQPEHSLVMAKLLAWELNISWWSDIAFTHLVQKFGEEKVREIIPSYPENAPTIIPDGIKNFPDVPLDLIQTDKAYREFFGISGTHIGSNSWVVDSSKSSSGKPIIANDPHLAFQAPGKWFVVLIRAPEWNAEGFSIPGLPGIVIGKNKAIAWTMTNVMADDTDFYVEQIDSTRKNYLLDGKWLAFQSRIETIRIKDTLDVEFKVLSNHRGPIISGIHPYNILYPNDEQNKANVSMKWTAFEFSDEMAALISVNKAKNWDEFKDALSAYSAPGQNFIYADSSDNIGYICAAKLPIRNSLSPTFVYDGTSSANDWKGFVPYNSMPKLFNPKEGFIASANNKTVTDFKYHITNLWEPPSRIERITELLKSRKKHSAENFKAYQNDFYSPYAQEITKYILEAFEKTTVRDKNLTEAINLLKKWSFEMDKYSQAPAIYAVFYQNMLKNIFEDEMGENLLKEYIFLANIPYRIIPELMENQFSPWFDDIRTDELETRNDIIRKSLVDALEELESRFGKNIARWQWGELHTVTFKHMFAGQSSIIDPLINIGPYPISGDGTTVFNTEYSFTKPYDNRLGPSMRFIYDFSTPDEFEFILTTGQSGHIASDHYQDMTGNWLKGKYIKKKLLDNYSGSDFDLFELIPGKSLN